MTEEERLVWVVMSYGAIKTRRELGIAEELAYRIAVETLKEKYAEYRKRDSGKDQPRHQSP